MGRQKRHVGQNGILPVAQAKIEASTAVSLDVRPRRMQKHCVRVVILHAKRITKSCGIRPDATIGTHNYEEPLLRAIGNFS